MMIILKYYEPCEKREICVKIVKESFVEALGFEQKLMSSIWRSIVENNILQVSEQCTMKS